MDYSNTNEKRIYWKLSFESWDSKLSFDMLCHVYITLKYLEISRLMQYLLYGVLFKKINKFVTLICPRWKYQCYKTTIRRFWKLTLFILCLVSFELESAFCPQKIHTYYKSLIYLSFEIQYVVRTELMATLKGHTHIKKSIFSPNFSSLVSLVECVL